MKIFTHIRSLELKPGLANIPEGLPIPRSSVETGEITCRRPHERACLAVNRAVHSRQGSVIAWQSEGLYIAPVYSTRPALEGATVLIDPGVGTYTVAVSYEVP
jgi:hypothetical protein